MTSRFVNDWLAVFHPAIMVNTVKWLPIFCKATVKLCRKKYDCISDYYVELGDNKPMQALLNKQDEFLSE